MKLPRLSVRMLTVFAILCAPTHAPSEGANGLLLPFPADASAEPAEAVPANAAVPERTGSGAAEDIDRDTRRALELAETFIRRQQLEVANSVPRRGPGPLLKGAGQSAPTGSAPAIAASSITQSRLDAPEILQGSELGSGGPSTELLPLPGDESPVAHLDSLLPDPSAIVPGSDYTPGAAVPGTESEVPRTDLAPAPAYGGVEDQDRRGPVFRVSGVQAYAVAKARGFKFTPAGGMGSRDGNHTAASQYPNFLTSEVHGIRMSQLRPPATWSVSETSNTFFMFCDANYNAVRLAPGWRIRGIRLEGSNWRWVACPRSGANTASFSIRVHSFKSQGAATAVNLAGLTLEGPEGAADWKDAFPWINGRGSVQQSLPATRHSPASPSGPESFVRARAANQDSEPPLPE